MLNRWLGQLTAVVHVMLSAHAGCERHCANCKDNYSGTCVQTYWRAALVRTWRLKDAARMRCRLGLTDSAYKNR